MRCTFLALLMVGGAASAAGVPEIGKPAPPLVLDRILQGPREGNSTWSSLEGSAVVIEFWATWCGGCRDNIPHLNRLAEVFRERPVRFLSVTDEDPDIVQRFLKDFPISGWIGIDSGERTFNGYGIVGRPQTILVDSKGIVRAIGQPSELTSAVLENLLAGRPVTLADPTYSKKLQDAPEAFFQTMIRLAAPTAVSGYSPGAWKRSRNGIEGYGLTVTRIASTAYGIPEQRIEGPDWGAKDHFDIAVTLPGSPTPDQISAEMRKLIETALQMRVRRDSREADVYELRKLPGVEPKLSASTSSQAARGGGDGNLIFKGATLASVAAAAAGALGLPAFDQTGISGRFDMELKWDRARPETFVKALNEQLGLTVEKTRRPLEYLVIESAVRPATW